MYLGVHAGQGIFITYPSFPLSLSHAFSDASSISAQLEIELNRCRNYDRHLDVPIAYERPSGFGDWMTYRIVRMQNHSRRCDGTCAIAAAWPGWNSFGISRKHAAVLRCVFCCDDWAFLWPKSICRTVAWKIWVVGENSTISFHP